MESEVYMLRGLKKIGIIKCTIFFFLLSYATIILGVYPTDERIQKREQMLVENIPEIMIYSSKIKLRDKLEVYNANANKTVAEAKFNIYAGEKDVLEYYKTELKKYGWDSIELAASHKSDKEKWMRYSGERNNNPTINFSIKFIGYDANNNISGYSIVFSLNQESLIFL